MAAAAGPALESLYDEFGEQIAFVTLYVREAHPGERVDQPQDVETKLVNARNYQARDQIPWPVVVDRMDGDLHRSLGPADTAYVMGTDGLVVGRLLWAADVRGVRQMLEAAAAGADRVERRTRLIPIVRGAAELQRILGLAGPRASRDVARVMPPVWLAGRIAGALPPMRPIVRGALATVAATALHVTLLVGAWTLVRRLRSRHPKGDDRERRHP